MKIKRLISENVKKLKAVDIEPKENLVIIAGRNAQGKSTVLDSIIYALGGKSVMDDIPIRSGEESAQIVLDLDKFQVIRNLTKTDLGFKQGVQIKSKDGAIYPSPQGMLDKLLEGKAFDPLEFSRMKPLEQQKMLAGLLKLDFTKFESERVRLEEQRRDIGREVNRLKARFSELSEPEVNLPDKPIDESTYSDEFAEVNKKVTANEKIKSSIFVIDTLFESYGKERFELEQQIQKLQNRVSLIKNLAGEKLLEKAKLKGLLEEIGEDPTKLIKQKIAEAKVLNKKIENKNLYVHIENELSDNVVEYDKYTQALEELKKAKSDYITSCEYPIEGLEVNDTGVMYNGLPFSQASSAEQLKVSLAIVEAFNSELRLCIIKDGSLLDKDSMEYLKQWSDEKDMPVWIEVVSNENKDADSIFIEDGMVIPYGTA